MPLQHRLRCLTALNDSISAVSSTQWVMPWNLCCFKICQDQSRHRPAWTAQYILPFNGLEKAIYAFIVSRQDSCSFVVVVFYFKCLIQWSTFQHCIQIKLPQLDFWLVDMNTGCSQFYFRKFLIEWCGTVEWQQKWKLNIKERCFSSSFIITPISKQSTEVRRDTDHQVIFCCTSHLIW